LDWAEADVPVSFYICKHVLDWSESTFYFLDCFVLPA
jgi:hypothetical protein